MREKVRFVEPVLVAPYPGPVRGIHEFDSDYQGSLKRCDSPTHDCAHA